MSLTKLAVHENKGISKNLTIERFALPKELQEDPILAKWIQEYDLNGSMTVLLKQAKQSLRASGENLPPIKPMSGELCSLLMENTNEDEITRKLMFGVVGRVGGFAGRAVGAGVGALFNCLFPPAPDYLTDFELDELVTPAPILRSSLNTLKFGPSSVRPVAPIVPIKSLEPLLRPPTAVPVEDDGDDEGWFDVDTDDEEWFGVDSDDDVASAADDEDEFYEVEEMSEEEIVAEQWKSWMNDRKRKRGIEAISPVDLTRIPSHHIHTASLLSKLSYHSVRDMNLQASKEIKQLLGEQVPGFPILIDSDPHYNTQAYLWLSKSRRTLFITFRGTHSWTDVKHDLDYRIVPLNPESPTVQVHAGFRHKFSSVVDELIGATVQYQDLYDDVVVSGHSLGAALATLAAPIVGETLPEKNVSCYTFGSPRVGNAAFVQWFNANVDVSLRLVNDFDPIQSIPFESYYEHVSHAISFSEDGQVSKVPDAPAGKRFWNALEDLDFDRFLADHRMDTYIVRINSLLKKHN